LRAAGGVGHAATAGAQEDGGAAGEHGVDTDIRSKSNEFFHLESTLRQKVNVTL
jgi:hypothetical protein